MYSHATSKSLSLLRKKGSEGIDPNIRLDPNIEGTSPLSSDDQIDETNLEDGTKYIELLDHKIQKLRLRNERLAEHLKARADDPFFDSKLNNFTDGDENESEKEKDAFKHYPYTESEGDEDNIDHWGWGPMNESDLLPKKTTPTSSTTVNVNKSIDSAFLPPRNAGFFPNQYKPKSSMQITPPPKQQPPKRPQTASHSQSSIFSSTPKSRPHSTQNTPRIRHKTYSSSSSGEDDAWMFKYGNESPTSSSSIKLSKSAYTSSPENTMTSSRPLSPSKSIVFGKTYYSTASPSSSRNSSPQITLPQPFEFDKRPEKVSISTQRLQMDLALKEWQPKPFKASPLPPNTKESLYEDLIASQTDRRREVKEQSYRKTREREAPFSFWKDEYANQKQQQTTSAEYRSPPFKANPVPPSTYDDTLNQLSEKEKEREERIKSRAKELMEIAALPPRMNEEFISKEKSKKRRPQSAQSTFTYHPQINTAIPDYKKLQTQFQEELAQKRASFKTTVPNPPNINSPKNTKSKILEDIESDHHKLNEMRWPYLSKRTYTPSTPPPLVDPVTPSSSTKATKLKRQVVEQKRLEQELKMKQEAEEERLRRIRQKQATKRVTLRLMNDTAAKELEKKERLERMKKESIGRTKEFKEYMKKMMDTLDNERLFLFERGPVDQAGRTASLKVDNTLRELGLEIDSLSRGIKYNDNFKPKKKEKSLRTEQEEEKNFMSEKEETSENGGSEKEISEELASDLDFDGSEKDKITENENDLDKSNGNISDELS